MRTGSWRPPGIIRSMFARTAAPAILVATIVVGTGWTHPEPINQGDPMKTIRHLWTQSISALTLLATIEPGVATAAQLPPLANPPADEAQNRFTQAVKADPSNGGAAGHDLALIREKQFAQASAQNPGQLVAEPAARSTGADPALAQRYGLVPKGAGAAAGIAGEPARASTESVRSIQSRLDQIVFDEVHFDSLPLAEVLKFLSEESRKRDPLKTGMNFLINPNSQPDASPVFTIDSTTGQPVSQTRSEPTDMSRVIVNFNLPLRQVRLTDVLNAIVKVADKPIQFSVEEYGVVFSPASGLPQMVGTGYSTSHPSGALVVRTYRVDTNTFFSGLESVLGINLSHSAGTDRAARSREVQAAVRSLMQELGVKLDGPTKTVFYNDLTGVLMVRATPDDIEIVEALVETLGRMTAGKPTPESGAAGSAATAPNSYNMDQELMRRYGLLPANNATSNSLK